ncbi:uncharacterized protein SPSC_05954 [Sporisorium scitamineum]|uniref:Uncharacterized protein n=1 Tax=Sporisorium scitamineum TaxID=49012 RepID=A0A0F7RTT1_9BASI|nr:hypothetical protein [Sporisorium scitamineum]CDU25783.1 uncharacterized protein SPSC_05954 [Sporisorium scitamineum]
MSSTAITESTDIPVRHYYLTQNGRKLTEQEEVHIPYESKAPLTNCIVVGVEGTSFQLRVSKDAYPDGVNIYIKGLERGSWKYWLEAKADYPYVYRNDPPLLRYPIPEYWEFDVDEWVFGQIDLVWAVVLGRDEFGEYNGKGTQMVYHLESIPPQWQGASQDAFLVERLNSISIRDNRASSSVATSVAIPGSAPPIAAPIAPPVTPPVLGPSSPAASRQATGLAQVSVSFDPLSVARLAIGSRGIASTPPASSGHGIKRGPNGALRSTSLSLTPTRVGKQRHISPREHRQQPIQEDRQAQSRDHGQQPPPRERTEGPVALGREQPGKSPDTGPAPNIRRGIVNIPSRPVPVVSDDSDDDTPLDQLTRGNRSRDATFAVTYAHLISPLPRRSGRIQALQLRSTASATPEKYDLTPSPYVSDKVEIELFKSFWNLPNHLLGYTITEARDVVASERLENIQESEREDESEDDEGQKWFKREEMAEWAQLIAGQLEDGGGDEDEDKCSKIKRWRLNPMPEEDPPLPDNYVRKNKTKRKGRKADSKKAELRMEELTGVERSEIGFQDPIMQECWNRYLGWIDIRKSQPKPDRVAEERERGARSLPSRL